MANDAEDVDTRIKGMEALAQWAKEHAKGYAPQMAEVHNAYTVVFNGVYDPDPDVAGKAVEAAVQFYDTAKWDGFPSAMFCAMRHAEPDVRLAAMQACKGRVDPQTHNRVFYMALLDESDDVVIAALEAAGGNLMDAHDFEKFMRWAKNDDAISDAAARSLEGSTIIPVKTLLRWKDSPLPGLKKAAEYVLQLREAADTNTN